MKAKVMKRAWEIVRTLIGDIRAKLSLALRMAWAEIKKGKDNMEVIKYSWDLDNQTISYNYDFNGHKISKEIKLNITEGTPKQINYAFDLVRKSINERMESIESLFDENLRNPAVIEKIEKENINIEDLYNMWFNHYLGGKNSAHRVKNLHNVIKISNASEIINLFV